MYVLAIDPGGTVGWSSLDTEKKLFGSGDFQAKDIIKLADIIPAGGPTVILERAFLNPAIQPVVFEVIGAVKFRVDQVEGVLYIHKPEDKEFIKKRFQVSKKGLPISVHEFEARCHLVFHLYNTLKLDPRVNGVLNHIITEMNGDPGSPPQVEIWKPTD